MSDEKRTSQSFIENENTPSSATRNDIPVLTDITPEESRRVLWKIDLCLIPILAICYMFQFLDKMTLNYATILGLQEDLKLVGNQFSWTASIFYFGYFVASYAAAYLSVKLPIGKYLACTVLLWAVALMFHAACRNFSGLMAVRFFLGMTEAGVAPGFSLVTGMWYTRNEQPLRHGLWFGGNSLASVFGGVAAYGVGHIKGSISPWQYLFIIFGAATFLVGIVKMVVMPDHPSTAMWLNKRERQVAIHRVMENQTGIKNNNFKKSQLAEALKDPKTWFLTLYVFTVNLANGGLTSFGSLVIAGFGYEGLDALLIQMPSGGAQVGFVLLSALFCSYVPNSRIATMFCLTLVSCAGVAIMYAAGDHRSAGLAGYCLSMAFAANMPLGLSLISSNVGGFTKKATVTGLNFVGYCLGNLIGPQFFTMGEAPEYPTGIRGCLSGLCLGAFFTALHWIYLRWENARRDKKYGKVAELSEEEKASNSEDKTDWEVKTFRYVL